MRSKKGSFILPALVPTKPRSLPRMPGLPPVVRGPKGSRIADPIDQPQLEDVPGWFLANGGNWPEYLVWWVLTTKMKMKPGEDFDWHRNALGGRIFAGGASVDFVVWRNFPPLALPVMGEHWHPMFGPKLAADLAIFWRLQTELQWEVIPLDALDLVGNAYYIVREAVEMHRNLSRYTQI